MEKKYLRLLLLCIWTFSTFHSLAQIPLNPVVFSTTGYDYITDATTDSRGNVYVLGSFDGKQGNILTPTSHEIKSNYNWYVAVYSKDGVLDKIGSVGYSGSTLHSIAVDKNNNIYVSGSSSHSITVSKFSPDFSLVWSFTEGVNSHFIGKKVLADEEGNVYVTGTVGAWSVLGLDLTPENSCCDPKSFLLKLNSQGKFVWIQAGLGRYVNSAGNSLAFDRERNLIMIGTISGSGTYGNTLVKSAGNDNLLLVKYTPNGNVLMAKAIGERNQNIHGEDIAVDEFNNFYITGTYAFSATFGSTTLPSTSNVGGVYREAFIAKLDSYGNAQWAKHEFVGSSGTTAKSIAYKEGKVQIVGMQGSFGNSKPYILSYLHNGSFLWKSYLKQVNGDATKVLISSGSTSQVFGTFFGSFKATDHTFTAYGIMDGYKVQLYDTTSATYSGFIHGNIYDDQNLNCQFEPNEKGIEGIIVTALPGPFFGITDSKGNYSINFPKGSYTIKPILPGNSASRIITPSCTTIKNVNVTQENSVIENIDFGNTVEESPYLNVSLSSNRRRRCMENVTTVTYSNTGFAPASNAKVTLQFPTEVIFKSASMPFTRDSKGNYVFVVGDLQPNQQGTITIKDSVSCADPTIRGLTVCTKAWITPVNQYTAPPTYNRADVAIAASETPENQARFVLRNQGQGAMTDSLSYRVLQNMELSLTGKYKLAIGDSLVLKFPTASRVIRVEADQPQGHPLKTIVSANLEMKKANTTGLPDIAMMAMPPNDPEPEITEECLPIIDSFDPNDKQVIPVGRTAEKYTPTSSSLRYTIRFQNTGNDVAYKVVVVDTLSADLDMSTFQVGAVTHPYTFTVSGKERPILTFTFNNIMLPDSGTNQAGSNGAIQFSIKPKANLPEKHLIENYADIFFDYNEPVRTNITQNRIFDIPPVISDKQLVAHEVVVSPNITSFSPTQGRAGQTVTIRGKNFSTNAFANKVSINGHLALILASTAEELKVVVPSNAFSGKIRVVTPDGSATTGPDFIIFQPPTITSVSPAEAVPGTSITISGTHFSTDLTLDTVYFNGVKAKITQASTTQLKVEVPATATKGKVLLKTLGGQVETQQPFMVWHHPTITSFSPGKGKTGTVVNLSGMNFAEDVKRNLVTLGSAKAEVTAASANSLTVTVPANAETEKIQVETPGGTARTASDFIFVPAPVISSFSPTSGYAGTTVTITGEHFGADHQTDVIYFNNTVAAILEATNTKLVVKAPKGVITGNLSVKGAGGEAIGAEFLVPDLSKEEALSIYPNPTQGNVTINWYKANYQVQNIEVFDSVGKRLFTAIGENVPGDEVQLNLFTYGAGVYTLRVLTTDGPILKRLVVVK
ncbi:IPT/TIG domain-containing protein [Rufibacter ruber]|uniref:IPT/TIG domain-containing protein n=1 Tax=Rufibacter ruber TaxID=1783499 RepID=UPI0009ECC651|nr:IPT/TIG domain-containing protein [Rufibacter ruber]